MPVIAALRRWRQEDFKFKPVWTIQQDLVSKTKQNTNKPTNHKQKNLSSKKAVSAPDHVAGQFSKQHGLAENSNWPKMKLRFSSQYRQHLTV
jgi:hypothetical protein